MMHALTARVGALRRARMVGLLVTLAVAVGVLVPSTAAANWVDSGPLTTTVENVQSLSIASVRGVPYLAFSEESFGVFVDRFSGGRWSQMGPLDFCNSDPSITDIGGVPYVACRISDQGNQIAVGRLSNGVWTMVGLGYPSGANNGRAIYYSPGIASDGVTPYVAWEQLYQDDGNGNLVGVFVSRFTNGAWQQPNLLSGPLYTACCGRGLGATSVPVRSSSARSAATAITPPTTQSSVPYVASSEYSYATGQSHVYVYRCTVGCTRVGGPIGNGKATGPRITTVNGQPYVAWCEATSGGGPRPPSGSCQMRVVRFAGGTWIPVGDPVNDVLPTQPLERPAITSVAGAPWVAWSSAFAVHVDQFGADRWQTAAGPFLPPLGGGGYSPDMTTAQGVPYVALGGGRGPGNLHVKYLSQRPFAITRLSAKRTTTGIRFSFTFEKRAAGQLEFTQPRAGREVADNCVAQTAANASNPGCTRLVVLGTLRFRGHAGLNKLLFDGRVSRHQKLKPGPYKVKLTATAKAGRRSLPYWLSITI